MAESRISLGPAFLRGARIHSGVACLSEGHEVTWEFPKIRGTLFGALIVRILLFMVLYSGPLFSETPT